MRKDLADALNAGNRAFLEAVAKALPKAKYKDLPLDTEQRIMLEMTNAIEVLAAFHLRKPFKVTAVSSNRNSFGLTGMVLIAQDGEAWQVGTNELHLCAKGDIKTPAIDGVTGEPDWVPYGFEIPERLKPDAPPGVIKEVWGP